MRGGWRVWAVAGLVAIGVPRAAAAWEPEFNAAIDAGGGFLLDDAGVMGDSQAWLALGADVQLFRGMSHDVGLGFGLRLGTRLFRELLVTGSADVILPVHEAFPVVLAGGAGVDALTGEGVWFGRFWWGARSHNMLSPYATAVGFFVEYQRAISGDAPPALLFGASIDGWALVWPFLWLYQWATVDQGPQVV